MATYRIHVEGRDTCNGTCQQESGCLCAPAVRHADCIAINGCARADCQQGDFDCWGRPLPQQAANDSGRATGFHVPMPSVTQWLVSNPGAAGPLTTVACVAAIALVSALALLLKH